MVELAILYFEEPSGPAEVTYSWLCPVCGQTEVPNKDDVCKSCADPGAA